jgi:polyisoprenoid-binding protein YceI
MIKKISLLLLTGLTFAFSPVFSAALEKFTIDPHHSYVLWNIEHLGFSSQTGKWYATGSLLLDKDHPQNSKVEAKIDLGNIVTGIPELDKHLLGKQFFDVKQYKEATFVSHKIEVLNKNKAKIYGTLTLHGISKPVVLDATLNKVGKNPINDKLTAGFSARAKLKRSDFGMNTLLPALGDEVDLRIEVEAYKDSDKAQG